MCYTLRNNESVKIAANDIVCYKIGRKSRVNPGCFNSMIARYNYRKNNLNPVVDLIPIMGYWSNGDITAGYHSYISKKHFASFYTAKFIVPKGSKYYSNEDEMVADRIIFIRFLFLYNLWENFKVFIHKQL